LDKAVRGPKQSFQVKYRQCMESKQLKVSLTLQHIKSTYEVCQSPKHQSINSIIGLQYADVLVVQPMLLFQSAFTILCDLATLLAFRGARSASKEGISSSNCQHCQPSGRQAGPRGALSSSPSRAAAAGCRAYWRGSGHRGHGGSTSPAQPRPSWPLLQPPTGKAVLLKTAIISEVLKCVF